MQENNSGECYVPWKSIPAFGDLLLAQIDEEEGGKQSTLSILQFIDKLISFLNLYNVRIVFPKEKKIEEQVETIISKIVKL